MHVVTIGNFDGVHEGHRGLLNKALQIAGKDNSPSRVTVVSFQPLPVAILAPGGDSKRLQTSDQRRSALLEAGADDVVELATTRELLGTDPEDFIEEILERLSGSGSVESFVEGSDFRFGRARTGSIDSLREHGSRAGFEVVVVPEVSVRLNDGFLVEVHSSTIRRFLELGRVEDAMRMLGRPYHLTGTVLRGDQRGRELGYPTANLDLGEQLLPGDGVYAGRAILPDGKRVAAAVSIGTKPTFEPTARVLEAHVLDWNGEIDDYGWVMNLELIRRLRGQEQYDGVKPLLLQLERDCARTRQVINLDFPQVVETRAMTESTRQHEEFIYQSNATASELASRLAESKDVLLLTHTKPDGDAIGTCLAIASRIAADRGGKSGVAGRANGQESCCPGNRSMTTSNVSRRLGFLVMSPTVSLLWTLGLGVSWSRLPSGSASDLNVYLGSTITHGVEMLHRCGSLM